MFKVALNAGHYLGTAGKRTLKSIDPKETRKWVLNDRVCDKVEAKLSAYDGYELLRIDDTSGKTNLTVAQRAAKANDFGADIYIGVHHNAGIEGGSGGGIMAYVYTKVGDYTKKMQKLLYDKLIAKTNLKGNRATPLAAANLGECRLTRMPAVLLELGFMDSTVDTPIILTEQFADNAADAITEAIVELGGLKPKANAATPKYFVQAGAFAEKKNADTLAQRLKAAGFDAIVKTL